ncbi:hypothetical protein [Microbacterium sp. NPDC089695]|uniref:hypothetical protein n=1 Tax=Microbacterium sp. NPDC089695 TaxID=3364198 RepID=UPI0037F1C217
MRTPSDHPLQRGTERMLIARVALALGLALLLVIGAWATSHRTADAHTALCLATGVSTSTADHGGTSAVVDASLVDAGALVIAAVCGVLLVLLLLRFAARAPWRAGVRLRRTVTPPRAGPVRVVPALTLVQLSLSRT